MKPPSKWISCTCSHCNVKFEVKEHSFKQRTSRTIGGRIFCSQSCNAKSRTVRKWRSRTCTNCFKDFWVPPNEFHRHKNKDIFCSRQCASRYRTRTRKQEEIRILLTAQ